MPGPSTIKTSEGDDGARTIKTRTIQPDDAEPLARLMLDAYHGTIDSEGETLDDAIEEVGSYFARNPMLDNSFLVERDGEIVSAVLVSTFDGRPFIGYVITDPEHKNQGLGTAVTATALESLRAKGNEKVALYITEGNIPSDALFKRLGAVLKPDD